jgi:hypothetical protein
MNDQARSAKVNKCLYFGTEEYYTISTTPRACVVLISSPMSQCHLHQGHAWDWQEKRALFVVPQVHGRRCIYASMAKFRAAATSKQR